jgi:hypothetical protein
MVRWKRRVDRHDYTAAGDYLSLRFDRATADRLVTRLQHAALTARRANDILRACDRPPLPIEDPGVRRTLTKIASGKKLSPVLVVSFEVGGEIADGYHRISAAYHLDPFAEIPVLLAD